LTVSLRGGFEQQAHCQLFQFTGYLGMMTFPLEILGWTVATLPRAYAAAKQNGGDGSELLTAARASFRLLEQQDRLDATLRGLWSVTEQWAGAPAEAVNVYVRALAKAADDQALMKLVVDTAFADAAPFGSSHFIVNVRDPQGSADITVRSNGVGERCGQLGSGLAGEVGHYCSSPRMAETLKRWPSCSGAPERACSVVSTSSVTTSSR
jgi:hypothetical protein